MNNFMDYVSNNVDYILSLLYNHIQYTFVAVLIAILIGVPLGITIYNYRNLGKPVLSMANLVQAIPSLAILGFVVPYFGIGASTAIFMVVIYSLLPILKNTYTGLSNINKDMLEAAKGIGMTNTQILFKVQFPLALPVIMAGIRISSVTAVGLMTIAAYIGADVLGTLILSGIQTNNTYMILAGAIPACILALVMDFVMSRVEKAVTPVSTQLKASNISPESIKALKRQKKVTIATVGTIFAVIFSILIYNALPKDVDIVVGSKEYTEGTIVANIYAEALERETDLTIERRTGLGGTMIAYSAILNREIDMYPDYTGTLYASVMEGSFSPGISQNYVYQQVDKFVEEDGELTLLEPSDINSTYVVGVSQEIAKKYNLKTVTDLSRVSSQLVMGCNSEAVEREDGLAGLTAAYDMEFGDVLTFASGSLIFRALDSGDIDVAIVNSTDPLVQSYDVFGLEDDKSFFPPYQLVPLVTQEMESEYPEAVEVINWLKDKLTDEVMQELNGRVSEDGISPEEVASDFLDELMKEQPYNPE